MIVLLVDLGWPSALMYALIGIAQRHTPDPDSCAARHVQCDIIGNPDFYGLGIRLGIYFQWLSALLAGPSAGEGLFVNYLVFALALYVTFFVFTFGTSCTFIAEVAIMLLISLGGIYIMLISRFYRNMTTSKARTRTGIGVSIAFDLLLFPTILYGSWFWCKMATGNVRPFAESPCGTTLFLFARVTPQRMRMASGFMAFVFVYTLLAVFFYQLSCAIFFLTSLHTVLLNRREVGASEPPDQISSRVPSVPGSQISIPALLRRVIQIGAQFDRAHAVFFRQSVVSYNCGAIALSVLGVELTLVWNSISGMYDIKSPGQLIPLIIGMGILGHVVWGKLTNDFESIRGRLMGRASEAVHHSAEHEGRTVDVEAGTSFQLPDSRWMHFPSHFTHTAPEPTS
ncbi:hypothetical protein CC80DRAFT_594309 [Byssothecium circinans]|uniref:Uncharacterized protein n=1 Tax=Byssothecium circinans TaxID=147558 RepID=A0A6A5TT56_9PLEO|nr:hypothetical protein CC80DRAFT_594309 [Byssothecium circinans]